MQGYEKLGYEKLGAFYLGKPYNVKTEELADAPLLYDAADLTTHAVCVGMTGSGKTGLCVSLLEEAALDGIPAIIIDPKGDLGNLMLTFPELSAAQFAPWVEEAAARRKGLSVDEYAVKQADLWRNGLASWQQDGERIRRLRQAADVRIYTPGSEAGLPVSILASLAAPPASVVDDGDQYGDRVETTVTSLLSLLGIEADPVQSREHLLLSNVLDHQWRDGKDVDLGSLIHLIQEPPVTRIGVLELESFYPAKERFKLAMQINSLLASPGFEVWLQGTPLDINRLLYNEQGKPQLAVFSIAHLSEAERMFFVALLLNQIVGWVRSLPGTSNLRALLYMDEVFGFMPPIGEPASKKPLLTLLKQARAYGLGVVLATQNPVDLDYKGLSNAGTWFLGRLQTERDKERVLEGLDSLSGVMSRKELDALLSQLGKRVFLLHNVHESGPETFHTRWAMSYLRGPLARTEIRRLMDPYRGDERDSALQVEATSETTETSAAPAASSVAPVVDPAIEQFYLGDAAGSVYQAGLVGRARLYYANRSKTLEHREEVSYWVPLEGERAEVDWHHSDELMGPGASLAADPDPGASFADLPAKGASPRSYSSWKRSFIDHLYRSRRCHLYRSAALDEISNPGEDERDFRIRLAERAREERDRQTRELRADYEEDRDSLEAKIRKAEARIDKEEDQARREKLSAAVSVGTAILSAVFGRKRLSSTTLSKTQSAVRRAGYAREQSKDVDRAEASLEALEEQLEELEERLTKDLDALEDKLDPLREELETVELRPYKKDIEVTAFGLGWRLG